MITYLNLYIKNLKASRILVQNKFVKLCEPVENSKCILCSRKTGVKYGYLISLIILLFSQSCG